MLCELGRAVVWSHATELALAHGHSGGTARIEILPHPHVAVVVHGLGLWLGAGEDQERWAHPREPHCMGHLVDPWQLMPPWFRAFPGVPALSCIDFGHADVPLALK